MTIPHIQLLSRMVLITLFFVLGDSEVSSKNPYANRRTVIAPGPTTEEIDEWFMELAGNNPARLAAVKRWIEPGGAGLTANYVEDRLEILAFEDVTVETQDLRDLLLFPEIDRIHLERSQFSDDALQVLSQQKHITSIWSEDARHIDNRLCAAIAEFPKLEGVTLINSQIDDTGAAHLSKLDSLSGLNLNGSRITSLTLKRFARLKNLKGLHLARTRIDDDGLQHVAKLDKLVWLDLGNTQVTDSGIEHLRPLKSLRVLLLANTAVTDQAVEVFASFDDPNRINLEGTKITNEAVRLLAPFPRFGDINLRNTAVDDGCVPHFEKMKALHTVDLRGTETTKAGIERIRAALKPTARLYNDHGVPTTDRARAAAEREK